MRITRHTPDLVIMDYHERLLSRYKSVDAGIELGLHSDELLESLDGELAYVELQLEERGYAFIPQEGGGVEWMKTDSPTAEDDPPF